MLQYPADKPLAVGLEHDLVDVLKDEDAAVRGLDAIKMQKLIDVSGLLQDSNQHVLEPLTLYSPKQLYELMASITEAWKNAGKSSWRKRISKLKENAKIRKAPRNKLDPAEEATIEKLKAKCKLREEWEKEHKHEAGPVNTKRGAGAGALKRKRPSPPASSAAMVAARKVTHASESSASSSSSSSSSAAAFPSFS